MAEIGRKFGMGNRVLNKTVPWRKCRDKKLGTCNTETDTCCAVIPCRLCLQWDQYGGTTSYGTADFVDGSWLGTVSDHTFEAYWQRNEYGECEFFVFFDDEEVKRYPTCAYDPYEETQNCRKPAGLIDVETYVNQGTLRFSTVEPRPLPRRITGEGCAENFCGDCECTCRKVCFIYAEGGGLLDEYMPPTCGDLNTGLVSNECGEYVDGVYWEADVVCRGDGVHLRLELVRDPYDGTCILRLTVNGAGRYEEVFEKHIIGCRSFDEQFQLDENTYVTATCVDCGGCQPLTGACCDGRCAPTVTETCLDPISSSLDVNVSIKATYPDGTTVEVEYCDYMDGTLDFKDVFDGGSLCWEGQISGSCSWCTTTSDITFLMRVCCAGDGESFDVSIVGFDNASCLGVQVQRVSATSCSPLLISGCFESAISCFLPCLAPPYFIDIQQPPTFTICFTISEAL